MHNDSNPPEPYQEPPTGRTSDSRLPVFPLFGFDNSDDIERDLEYMKQLYPRDILSLQKEIENVCDQMEYDGSPMYDSYPDKVYLQRVADSIYLKAQELDSHPDADLSAKNLESYYGFDSLPYERDFYPGRPPYGPCKEGPCGPPYENPWLRNVVNVLFFNELLHRRRRYRGYKRFF